MQTTAARVDSYEELPEHIREYVAEHAPSHVAPPADDEEIARLRDEYLGDTPPEGPKSDAPARLSNEEIADVVGHYFSCLRQMEVDELLELFTEDALSWDPVGTPPMRVRDRSTNYFRALSKIFDKMALTEEGIFVSGNEAAVKWNGEAKLRTKDAEIKFDGISVFEISPDGLIQNVRSYWDKPGLMASL
jgi:steroid delta-isomerase